MPRCLLVPLLLGLAVSFAHADHAAAQTRALAPGVITTITPKIVPEETTSAHDLIEVLVDPQLEWKPEFEAATRILAAKSKDARFRRDIWALEFSFKPVRMIWVDVPRPDGKLERKLVWYMVYQIKHIGAHVRPTAEDGGDFSTEPAPAEPHKFLPQFVLESKDADIAGEKVYRAYLDRVVPVAIAPISKRETPGRKLLNSVEIAEQEIAVSTETEDNSVWGVATWVDVDPGIDHFSIYIGGLTNSYIWRDSPGEFKQGDPVGRGRRMASKVLQLNFWRPGDEFLENETEIRYGVPKGKHELYGVKEGVAHRWLFR